MSKIVELNNLLESGRASAKELLSEAIKKAEEADELYNIFVSKTYDKAEGFTDKQIDYSKSLLAGIPTAVKDNFNWEGTNTTASSNMLKEYESPYSSTIVQRLLDNNASIIGKTNMDAFAHGSSTATSDFFTTLNPFNKDYYPGGSSGGSAAAVAAGIVPYSIGSETAGSIRQPSAWCGLVGLVPTYGRLSRYGLVAMGSSFDRPGPIATTVEDCAIVIDALSGKDSMDATSVDRPKTNIYKNLDKSIKSLRIGLPNQYWDERIDDSVRSKVKDAISLLEKAGAEIVEIDLLDPKYSIAVYTIVCRSEVSSNLARLDGIRYGHISSEIFDDVLTQISNNRGEGFGKEAKQRSMTGAYTLSAGYYDAYYKKAQIVRNLIKQDLEAAFDNVDVIVSPTTPTVALKVGDPMVDNPLFGELSDVLVEASALSGMPSLNIPVGLDEKENMPVGMQLIGRQWDEQTIANVGYAYQEITRS